LGSATIGIDGKSDPLVDEDPVGALPALLKLFLAEVPQRFDEGAAMRMGVAAGGEELVPGKVMGCVPLEERMAQVRFPFHPEVNGGLGKHHAPGGWGLVRPVQFLCPALAPPALPSQTASSTFLRSRPAGPPRKPSALALNL